MLEMGRFPDYPGSILVTLFELYFTLTPHTFFFLRVCLFFSLSLTLTFVTLFRSGRPSSRCFFADILYFSYRVYLPSSHTYSFPSNVAINA